MVMIRIANININDIIDAYHASVLMLQQKQFCMSFEIRLLVEAQNCNTTMLGLDVPVSATALQQTFSLPHIPRQFEVIQALVLALQVHDKRWTSVFELVSQQQ